MAKRVGANGRKKNAAHRGPVRGNGRRKMLFAAFTFAGIAAAGCILIGVYGNRLQSPALAFNVFKTATAQQVEIRGAVQVNPEDLLKRSGIVFPVTLDQLKRVHLAALQNASPWIEKIKIIGSRKGKIILGISERKPVAMLQTSGTGAVCLVDAGGVCLPLGAETGYPLPLVSGLDDSAGGDGVRRITAAGVVRMNAFLRDASFDKRITQINFSRPGVPVVRLMLEGSATVVVVNENDIAGCSEKYAGLWETVRNDSLQPLRIDLAYQNLAFVTMPQPAGAGESIAKKTKG